jgi:hypothetical protein
MIDGEGVRLAATAATLDDLFRRAGVRHPHTLALADPPNRDVFAWGASRKLSFAQADRAISACAARLRGLGLQTDSNGTATMPARSTPRNVTMLSTVFGRCIATMLSTIPITSFAGIALTMMPWLLCGGTLHLHHGFEAEAFDAQCREIPQGTLVLPPAVPPIATMGLIDAKQTILALWRAPERVKASKDLERTGGSGRCRNLRRNWACCGATR